MLIKNVNHFKDIDLTHSACCANNSNYRQRSASSAVRLKTYATQSNNNVIKHIKLLFK